jgi:hypothetical protein
MPGPRRNRERRPGRRPPFRDPRPIILIVCEGERTEKEYFEGFAHACHNQAVRIKLAREHGVPRTLVQTAKKYKKESEAAAKRKEDPYLAYDAVWCVFDVDDHPQVADARQMARANEIELAISNPCFEFWLLLHFRDSPGMQHRDTIRKMLLGHVAGYDKEVDYGRYSEGYSQAVKRAEQMDKKAEEEGDSGRNPTTGVYRLTRDIERAG